jgi:hypothetical protein
MMLRLAIVDVPADITENRGIAGTLIEGGGGAAIDADGRA